MNDMEYKFFLLSAKDAKDPGKMGWAYALHKKDEWVSNPEEVPFLTVGYNKGSDYIVVNDVAYMIYKSFTDITNDFILFFCIESEFGCDVKSFT